ncbi:MAG TPA: undecaprenyl-phosphate glucose phosphotransferase [Stellaceae bacterium]|nr:undecaprenyl-phosphate glucose phosphotransferase [Stellaceae bacterium]
MPLVLVMVQLGDALSIAGIGVGAALWARSALSPLAIVSLAGVATFAALNLMHKAGAYRQNLQSQLGALIRSSLGSWIFTSAAVAMLVLAAGEMSALDREWLELWFVGTTGLILLSRYALWVSLRRWRRRGRMQRKVAVLGAGQIGQRLIQNLLSAPEAALRIAGVYDDRRNRPGTRLPKSCLGHPIRGTVDDLVQDIRAGEIDCVFVALPLSAEWRLAEIMNKLCLVSVDVRLCADNFGFRIGKCDVGHVSGLTVLNVCNKPLDHWRAVAKAIEDKVFAAVFLALAAPLIATVAVLVKLDSPGPVFFRQKRRGLNNELIEVLKFRTLYDHASDPNAERLSGNDDPRVTRVGAILRRTMIDELPQFINVLRGDMSIVGPRPHALAAKAGGVLYPEAVRYYDARHRVKPGITGWAQVNGWRGETRTVEEIRQRVEHDLYYIHHWSIPFDLEIIGRTILGLFVGFFPMKQKTPNDHALPVANLGRSRSAA